MQIYFKGQTASGMKVKVNRESLCLNNQEEKKKKDVYWTRLSYSYWWEVIKVKLRGKMWQIQPGRGWG